MSKRTFYIDIIWIRKPDSNEPAS